MAYLPLHICFVVVAAALLGCSPYIDRTLPSAAELEAQAKERKLWYAKREAEIDAELSVWKVECSDDLHGTAERRCSARNGRDLIVTFVDGRGPYVQAGPHWHVDTNSRLIASLSPVAALCLARRTTRWQACLLGFDSGFLRRAG